MSKLIETKEEIEQFILVAVSTSDNDDTQSSLEELEELVLTTNANVLGTVIQNRDKIHSATYLGKGKIEELKELILSTKATGIVCDDELSPLQMRNLCDLLEVKVIDRTMLILDIFAKRATTKEGKIQVELAQLRYSSARLVGLRMGLSRQGGGIGSKGPGEKKIELDKRLIHEKIGYLKAELKEIQKHRDLIRNKRTDKSFVVAIVGYTNAGKSTLLNTLTDSDIYAKDQLFATLDPTTRKLELPNGSSVLLTDTVGFIRKLPHHLIEAFKSTLEEAKYADLILHIVDVSDKEYDTKMLVVYDTLKGLDITGKDIVTVYNKIDCVEDKTFKQKDFHSNYQVNISAKTGYGLDELQSILEEILRNQKVLFEHIFSYVDAGKIQEVRKYGELISEEYKDDGIHIKAFIPSSLYLDFIKKSNI